MASLHEDLKVIKKDIEGLQGTIDTVMVDIKEIRRRVADMELDRRDNWAFIEALYQEVHGQLPDKPHRRYI